MLPILALAGRPSMAALLQNRKACWLVTALAAPAYAAVATLIAVVFELR